jgi:DNA repair photolyase
VFGHAPTTRRRDAQDKGSVNYLTVGEQKANIVLASMHKPLNHPFSADAGGLVGIARQAAASPLLHAKRRVEYFQLPSESVLNRCTSARMPFRWTVNPYRGCEFGCKYCYARYTHEFMGMNDPLEFEEKIYSKRDAANLLRRELATCPNGDIAIGTATDPYQPAERIFGTTRSILEVLNEFRGLRLSITSKSDLITRDIPLLEELAVENEVDVHITVTTLCEDLARLLEPRAPRPELRLNAVRALSQAGVPTQVNCMPVLPGITDGPGELETLAGYAADAGAMNFATSILFLKPSAKAAFMPFLKAEFPELVRRYEQLYARGAYLRGPYQQELGMRVAAIRRRHGWDAERPERDLPAFGTREQLPLFDTADLPAATGEL